MGEAIPDVRAVYVMPGADVDDVLTETSRRGLLTVTGFMGLVEAGKVSIGLEVRQGAGVAIAAHAGRLAAEGQVMPESLNGITRAVDNA